MFGKTKKIAGVLLASAMIATAFAGCGGGGTDTSSTAGGSSEGSSSAAPEVKAITVDEMMADAEKALGTEGTAEEVKLKVWAPADAVKVFQEQCDAFAKNFSDRKITIEVVAQEESDAAANVMNDPSAAADVFGFASDQASKLYPGGYTAQMRADYAAAIKESNLDGAIDVSQKDGNLVAFPETGDNSYFVYYDKGAISEDEIKSMEGIMKVCNEKDKKFIMNLGNGYYGCVIPLTAGGTYELAEDGTTQVLNYDKDKVVKVAKSFADLLANDKHFVNDDTDKVLVSQLKTGKALAGVSGTWKSKAIKAALGDNFACAKLPSIKVDGTDTDMVSMYGYKLIGVNSNTKYPYTAQALAYYLTGEKCQTERMEKLGWGPSIKALSESDTIKNDPCLSAVYDQQKHSFPQIGLAGSFWDPTGAFGSYIVEKSNDLSEEGIAKAYDSMVTSITAQ